MQIYIREVGNKGVFDAFLDGNLLVRSAVAPLLTAARTLLAIGTSPDEPLRMWHMDANGPTFPSLTTTVGVAAGLRMDQKHGCPRFTNFRPGEPEAPLREAAE